MFNFKKLRNQILAFLLIFSLLPQHSFASAENPIQQSFIVEIKDPYLEWIIRGQLDKSSGSLTKEDMESLTGVSAQGYTINSLNGLEHATNLEILHVNDNKIVDLTPIQNLVKLKTLSLQGNKIQNLQQLEDLLSLEQLNISNNEIEDINVLHNKTNLKQLYVGGNAISDISPLQSVTLLEVVNLDNNGITSIASLKEHTLVKELSIHDNPLNLFTDVESATFVKRLLDSGAIVTGNDETAVEVEDAHLAQMIREQIEKPVGQLNRGDLSRLTELIAVDKEIRNLKGLEHAVNLRFLNVDQNEITDLGQLASLTNLEHLEVLDNNISDLNPIKNLGNVTLLDLGSNQIKNLEPLAGLTNITELTISDNQITNINALAELTELEWLDLEANEVNDLSPLASLQALEMLDVSGNGITDMNQITSLGIPDDVIHFEGNPVAKFETWTDAEGEGSVPNNKEWTITFNQTVFEESINRETVYVTDGQTKLATELVVAENHKEVKILPPANGYDSGMAYTIHITKGVKTKNGQYLNQPILKNFTVVESDSRGTQNLISEPLLSERKLLKFAHLAYFDFHKLGDEKVSIHEALRQEYGFLGSKTLKKKWDKEYQKVEKNLNKYNREALSEDQLSFASISNTVGLAEISDWKFIDVKTGRDGFYAVAFQSPDESETVIAYRGSDNPFFDKRDWIGANLLNALKTSNLQVYQAINFAQEIKTAYPNTNLFLTGHSLGGWLAQRVAAEELDVLGNGQFKKAVTFNAPGFSEPWGWQWVSGNYLNESQWKNATSPAYLKKIDNVFIDKDFVGTYRTHLGTDITFPINHIISGIWGLKWHGVLNFYYPKAFLTDAERIDVGYDETTIIRDLWKSDFHEWFNENRPGMEADIDFMDLPVNYDEPFELILRKTPGHTYEEKAYKFTLPERVTADDKLIISPIKMQQSLNVRIYNTDTGTDPRRLEPLFENRFSNSDENMEVDISNLTPGSDYYLFLNGESDDIYRLVFESQGLGTISGKITNAITGYGESGLQLNFRTGTVDRPGAVEATVTTDYAGDYSVELPGGNYVMEVSGEGFMTKSIMVMSPGNGQERGNQNTSISPLLPEGEVRIILEWGEYPYDLDSHLTGPILNSTERFHVYYGNRTYGNWFAPLVELDVDDVTSYGPETITIYNMENGRYRYSVHDYTNRWNTRDSMGLANSGAKVRVIFSDGREKTFHVPQNTPGTLWTVFEIDNNRLIPINRLSMEESPSYIQGIQGETENDLDVISKAIQENEKEEVK